MKGHHKKYTLHCEALSPIHIGSGEILSRWEYVVIGNQLYYTTDEFWQKLREIDANAFNKLVESINSDDSASLTKEFDRLPQKGVLQSALEKSSLGFKPLKSRLNKPIIRSINCFAGAPDYYIPGSSIKGAFRGAYEIMDVDNRLFKIQEKDFLNTQEARRNFYQTLKAEFKNLSHPRSKVSQYFQQIRIADVAIPKSSLSIIPVSFTSKDPEEDEAIEFYECIKVGTNFIITVIDTSEEGTFFKKLLDEAGIFYRANFIKLKNRSVNKNTEVEEFYNTLNLSTTDPHEPKKYLFRCGFGSGQLCNSTLSSWTRFSADTSLFWQGVTKEQGKVKAGYQYPASPKRDIQNDQPLGWIRLHSS